MHLRKIGRAEREGFEPSRPLRAYGISSAAPSTELGDRSAGHSSNHRLSGQAGANQVSSKLKVLNGSALLGKKVANCVPSALNAPLLATAGRRTVRVLAVGRGW